MLQRAGETEMLRHPILKAKHEGTYMYLVQQDGQVLTSRHVGGLQRLHNMSGCYDEELLCSSQAVTFSSLLLFDGITHTKHGEELRSAGSLRYSCMRELLVAKLRELGFDTKNFTLDSLQAGGAIAAANAGVTEEVPMSVSHCLKL